MRRSASPLRLRTALFVLAVALVAVGAVQPGAQSRASASWKVPRTPWGAPDLQGVWTSADLSARDAPQAPRPPLPLPAPARAGRDVNPPNHWGERDSACDVRCPADDAAGTGACRDAEARVRQFHDRQLRRPRRARHVGAVPVARHAGRDDADGVRQQLSDRAVAGSRGGHRGNDS